MRDTDTVTVRMLQVHKSGLSLEIQNKLLSLASLVGKKKTEWMIKEKVIFLLLYTGKPHLKYP